MFYETPTQVLILLVGVALIVKAVWDTLKTREKEKLRAAREQHLDEFVTKVLKFFKDSEQYFEQSALMLEMAKVYTELARANNKDAKVAADETRNAVKDQMNEIHEIGKQAIVNAEIVKDKADELKEVIPDLTVDRLRKANGGDSGMFKTPTAEELQ